MRDFSAEDLDFQPRPADLADLHEMGLELLTISLANTPTEDLQVIRDRIDAIIRNREHNAKRVQELPIRESKPAPF